MADAGGQFLQSLSWLSLHIAPELETFTNDEPFWVKLVFHEVNNEVIQPANFEGDKFEFVNLPPVEVKEEQVSVNECRLCGFTAPPMQTILLVRHMREVHGGMAETSTDAKRRKLAGEDPLSHNGGLT